MSVRARLLLFFMKLVGLKSRLGRRSFDQLHRMSVPDPPANITQHHTTEKINVSGARGYWIARERAARGVLVYLHGGGYTFGPVDFQWEYIASLASRVAMAAVVIDYRQLPLHAFPDGLDDAIAVIAALQQDGSLAAPWFLIGDSAGGGLAAAACYRLEERGLVLPRRLILISPWLDVSATNPDMLRAADSDPIISLGLIRRIAAAYAAGTDVRHPLVSPLYGRVESLPPVLLQTGTRELLVWDCRVFDRKCRGAGVPIRYEEYPGLFHDFVLMNFLPEGQRAQRAQLDWILEG